MLSQVKLNPTRIRLPKNGNALMLLMERAANYKTMAFLGIVTEFDMYFEIEIRGTKHVAQAVKKYINDNL